MTRATQKQAGYVPPLLKPYQTLSELYRVIVDNPAEDDPKLRFSDACREAAEECPEGDRTHLENWADFIAAQFKIHALGDPPLRVLDCDTMVPVGGPDYFQFDVGDESPIKVGDRVDVAVTGGCQVWRGLRPEYHNLLVRRIGADDWSAGKKVTAVRDALSVPFPHAELRAAQQRADDLFGDSVHYWYGHSAYLTPHYAKGFVARLWLRSEDLYRLCEITAEMPITHVEIQNNVQLRRVHLGRVYYFSLPGMVLSSPFYSVAQDAWHMMLNRDETLREAALNLLQNAFPKVVCWKFPGVSL